MAALALEVVASKSETQGHLSGCGEQSSRTWSSFHLTRGTETILVFWQLNLCLTIADQPISLAAIQSWYCFIVEFARSVYKQRGIYGFVAMSSRIKKVNFVKS